MNGGRKGMRRAVRILGAGVLCALLSAALLLFAEKKEVLQPARIVFAGTKDDADCAILRSRDACVVIDTGEEQDAAHILELLCREEAGQIDCLILTHPDKDHIGGAPILLENIPVKQIVTPCYDREKETYDALLEQAEEQGVNVLTLTDSQVFYYGELTVRIWPPEKKHYEKDNDYSLAALVEHGGVRLFFAGDAQKKRMKELLTYRLSQVDLYKVSHHGRDLTTGARLILSIQPAYAVVTADAPGPEIERALRAADARVICTRGRDAVFISDGECLTEPSLFPEIYALNDLLITRFSHG